MEILNCGFWGYLIAGLYCFAVAAVIFNNACLEVDLHRTRRENVNH